MGNSASNDDTSSLNSKSTSDHVAELYGTFAVEKFAVVTGVTRKRIPTPRKRQSNDLHNHVPPLLQVEMVDLAWRLPGCLL